jgi:hypothetical protein
MGIGFTDNEISEIKEAFEGGRLQMYNLGVIDDTVQWQDIKFPFIGRNLDTSSGRIDYDFAELGVGFQNNARYNVTEQVSMIAQLNHDWKIGSWVSPHIHWQQKSSDIPNFMIEYRWYGNGDLIPSTWIKRKWSSVLFSYTGGTTMLQILEFPNIVPTGITGVSSFIDIKFYRDTGNDSGLFTGADPSSLFEVVKEFDIHYQLDSAGSRTEYIK